MAYITRKGHKGYTDVVYASPNTGAAKEFLSTHRNPANAQRVADRLNRLDRFDVEVTDTMGGDANYSWVRRYVIALRPGCTDRAVIIAAKRAAGWDGTRHRRDDAGEVITLRPSNGDCVVMFITYRDE